MLAWIGAHIVALISYFGYGAVFFLMTLESACIPVPSELILTFSGFLVSTGRFQLVWVAFAGALGNTFGSLIAYAIGYYGGRRLADRYGRWLLVAPGDLDRAEHWFRRRGDLTILVCRMLPLVRTFIALPAGVARMRLLRFSVYTFLGSLPWCYLLAYAGYQLGNNWTMIEPYFRRFDVVWAPLILIALGLAIWHHVGKFKAKLRSDRIKVS